MGHFKREPYVPQLPSPNRILTLRCDTRNSWQESIWKREQTNIWHEHWAWIHNQKNLYDRVWSLHPINYSKWAHYMGITMTDDEHGAYPYAYVKVNKILNLTSSNVHAVAIPKQTISFNTVMSHYFHYYYFNSWTRVCNTLHCQTKEIPTQYAYVLHIMKLIFVFEGHFFDRVRRFFFTLIILSCARLWVDRIHHLAAYSVHFLAYKCLRVGILLSVAPPALDNPAAATCHAHFVDMNSIWCVSTT